MLSAAGRPRHGLTPGWPWQDPRANTDPECPREDGGRQGAGRLLQGHQTLDTKPAVPSLPRGGALAAQGHECAFVCCVCVCVCVCVRARACLMSMPAPPAARSPLAGPGCCCPAAGRQRAPSDRALSWPHSSRPGSSLGRQVGG